LGGSEPDKDNIIIYPTVTSGDFVIEASPELSDVTIEIISSVGKIVLHREFETLRRAELNLNAEIGVYLVNISIKGKHLEKHRIFKVE